MNLLTNLWAIPFPGIDPVALQIGPVAIKWYGLAYLAGLLLGWLYIRHLLTQQYLPASCSAGVSASSSFTSRATTSPIRRTSSPCGRGHGLPWRARWLRHRHLG